MQKEDTENTGRILIAGAGIGGLSASLALARCGLRSYIIERAPEIQEIGAGVQIGPNAFRAFTRLGIAAEITAEALAPEYGRVRFRDTLYDPPWHKRGSGAYPGTVRR